VPARLLLLAFVFAPSLASAAEIEFKLDQQLFAFWGRMPQMGTSGTVELGRGTSAECASLALPQAKVSLDYAIRRRGAWAAFKMTLDLSPVGGKALDAVSLVVDYLDSESPEDFAKKIGKTLVSKGAGKLAGKGAGYGAGKGAGKLYDQLTAKLKKGFFYSYQSSSCGVVDISAFVRRRADQSGLEMVLDIAGDCQCRVKRFGLGELGAWSVRGVLPLDHATKGAGADVTVTFSVPAGAVGTWHVSAQCPCKEPRSGDDSAGGVAPDDRGTRIPAFNEGFTSNDWVCLNRCFDKWTRYRSRESRARETERTAQKAEASAKSAEDMAAKNRAGLDSAKATLKNPPQGDPSLGDILRKANDTIKAQKPLDETAQAQRTTADRGRSSANLSKRLAEAALAELKDCLRHCIQQACAPADSTGFGDGKKNYLAPDWARAFQTEILLPLLEEMREAGQLKDCPRKKDEDVAYEEGTEPIAYGLPAVGAVALRVTDAGKPVPGATVRLFDDSGEVAKTTSDVTGAVRVPLKEGDYRVEVDSGGEPIASSLSVEGGALDSYVVNHAVTEQSDPLDAALPLLDIEAQKGFRASYRAENALVTVELGTPEGIVYLSAAELMVPQTRVTWGITLFPAGDTPKTKGKNRDRLDDYALSVGGVKVDLEHEEQVRVDASVETRVTLVRKRKEVISGLVPTRVGQPSSWRPAADIVRVGEGLSFLGSFDGDASNTRIRIGGEDARIVAESTLCVSVYTSATVVGPVTVTIVENGEEHQVGFRSLGLGMSIDKATLLRGESTTAHFKVTGLAGIATPVHLAVVNATPGIISLAPRNAQVFSIAPGSVGKSGEFQLDRGVTGVVPGGFIIQATVLTR